MDSSYTQKSKYLQKEISYLPYIKKVNSLYIKGFNMAKNDFLTEVTLIHLSSMFHF